MATKPVPEHVPQCSNSDHDGYPEPARVLIGTSERGSAAVWLCYPCAEGKLMATLRAGLSVLAQPACKCPDCLPVLGAAQVPA
jgi:hypothetical protein